MVKDISDVFEFFLGMDGQKFRVERSGEIIAIYDGLTNTEKNGTEYIGFRPDADIQVGDYVINTVKERFYVRDRKMDYVSGEPNELKIYYNTEAEYNNLKSQTASTVFNISNASGSVIGNYNTISISYNETLSNLESKIQNADTPDKEELQELVRLLKMVVDDRVPVSKGFLAKFSDVMERNSWITGSITSAILGWLTSHI